MQASKPAHIKKQQSCRLISLAEWLLAIHIQSQVYRLPEPDRVIKSATVSQGSDGKYYVSVLFEYSREVSDYVADITNAIGLDYASVSDSIAYKSFF